MRTCRQEEPAVEQREAQEYHIDLNSAGADLLTLITGIGPRLAAALVEWRDQNGPFQSVGDLLEVRGIGPHRAREILRWSNLDGRNACQVEAISKTSSEVEGKGLQ
jgi:competence protein ComEA